ncbi:hypothetical protein R5R35_001983 [Gryllus longicercus]|uniref:Proline-rich transmembrane protein 3/4 domain-containing protein n=1 Tax=Gryllus longicercus TaxID=2509291 RepID=A0AAN9VVE3_9ORTH|nr:Protein of unknown function [Gryllus bimaculatus]
MAVLLLVLLWLTTLSAGTDISYLDRSLLEKDIAAVFNKVSYGGITTTKRSISSKHFPPSGSPTTVAPPFSRISLPTAATKSSTPPSPQFVHSTQDTTQSNSPLRSIARHNTTLSPLMAPKTISHLHTTAVPREVPSYIPPQRSFFTPPLPPEYINPFADKPTLRGSYSDSGSSNAGRRPVPPQPPPPGPQPGRRIPLRPPDLVTNIDKESHGSPPVDRKKPLNTPSFNRPPEAPYAEMDNIGPNMRANGSEPDFVPMLHFPDVERILSSSNGRKQVIPEITNRPDVDSKVPQLPEKHPKLDFDSNMRWNPKQDVPQTLPKPEVEQPKVDKSVIPELNDKLAGRMDISRDIGPIVGGAGERQAERLPDSQKQPPKIDDATVAISPSTPAHKVLRDKWSLAWDIHVYLMGSLFTFLSLYSVINIARVNACKRLLSHGYYIALHGLLFVIGILRGVYLFYDAYNRNKSFPEPISLLMLNVVSPCITSAFLILFLFLLQAAKVHVFSVHLQRPAIVAIFITLHVILCVSLDLATGIAPNTTFLPLICQCLFVVICVCLGLAYLYVYRLLAKSAARKQENVFGSAFTNFHRPTLATAVRTTLATALLSLLMAAVQLYGIFGVYEVPNFNSKPPPWLWWGYQFSVRVIEISMCFLFLWAGVQPLRQYQVEEEKESQSSGFALFRCRQCTNTPQNSEAADDIYPAVCVTNQAIHDYTVRTGKKVYDDSFPLNNLHSGFPLPESSFSISTSERRLLRKSGYPPHDASFPVNENCTSERRSVKKSGAVNSERPEFDLPFSTTSEVRRSLKNSGTLILLNMERPDASSPAGSSTERRSLKKSSALESNYPVSASSEMRHSIKKSGTLVSLNSERRTPINQHKCGAQTLSSTRERVSPSMLVAENGFVRFRTLADPEEQDVNETMHR